MSESFDSTGADPDRIVLAGEYVLGTLPQDERLRVAVEMRTDPRLRDEVAAWERHLAPLAATVPLVTPPVELWRRIERSMRSPVPILGDRRRRTLSPAAIWKGATAASFLLAAGIAFVVLMDRVPLAVPLAALSPMGAPEATFVVEARSDGMVEVLPLHPTVVPAGRDYQLWSLADGATVPRSLGILPAVGRKLRGASLPRGRGKILISLEPSGGSPTGLPTGPVLYGGTVSRPD